MRPILTLSCVVLLCVSGPERALAGGGTCSGSATAATASYGTGKAGINGVPVWTALNLPTLPSASFMLSLTNGAPNGLALLAASGTPASIPFDEGTLLVQPIFTAIFIVLDGSGSLAAGAPLPANAALCGATVYTQFLIVDPSVSSMYQTSQSNGLAITFGD